MRRDHPPHSIQEFLRAYLLPGPVHQQRKGERRRPFDVLDADAAAPDAGQCPGQAALLQLFFQHFPVRLKEEQVVRIVAGEHVVQEPARGLHLLGAPVVARISLEDQAGHPCDLAKLPPGQLRGVETGGDVVQQVIRRDQACVERFFQPRSLGRQQFEPVVVRGEGEGNRTQLGESIGKERGEPFMNQASFDWIEEEMMSLPGFDPLDEELIGGGNAGPSGLELQNVPYCLHFVPNKDALSCLVQLLANRPGELGGER